MRSVFMARLIGETEKIVDAAQIPAAELSSQVVVGFTVDETGNVTQWRFLDNTCEGKDSVGVEPVTPRTREAMTEALGRLEKWTPAMKDGKPTTYSWRLTMRLPVEKIAKKQDADPLLFLGGDPDKTFHEWLRRACVMTEGSPAAARRAKASCACASTSNPTGKSPSAR